MCPGSDDEFVKKLQAEIDEGCSKVGEVEKVILMEEEGFVEGACLLFLVGEQTVLLFNCFSLSLSLFCVGS